MSERRCPGAGQTARGASFIRQPQRNLAGPEVTPCSEPFQRLGDVSAQVVAQLRVHLHEDGSFDYSTDGVLASVLPVPGLDGAMEDIVAWGDDPARWWLRRRLAVILGMDAAEQADYLHEPLTLLETPADWVRGGKRGAVVLDWRACLGLYLPQVSTIKCESERLACRLRKALALSPPKVEVKGQR